MHAMSSFKLYVLHRPYGFGRGNSETWQFIAWARGQVDLPDVSSWPELRLYLESVGQSEQLKAARTAWATYAANVSRSRQRDRHAA
jgi:hypothetical protein